jgi:hypothetical protein
VDRQAQCATLAFAATALVREDMRHASRDHRALLASPHVPAIDAASGLASVAVARRPLIVIAPLSSVRRC